MVILVVSHDAGDKYHMLQHPLLRDYNFNI